jgi:hypothetical protein
VRGEIFTNPQGRTDARLRVIFDNGTESGMLMCSLLRQLNEDEAGRRIADPSPGPRFADKADDGETEAGTIYVLRSKSEHPTVTEHRQVMHKIGVTSGSVEARISGGRKEFNLPACRSGRCRDLQGLWCQPPEDHATITASS